MTNKEEGLPEITSTYNILADDDGRIVSTFEVTAQFEEEEEEKAQEHFDQFRDSLRFEKE